MDTSKRIIPECVCYTSKDVVHTNAFGSLLEKTLPLHYMCRICSLELTLSQTLGLLGAVVPINVIKESMRFDKNKRVDEAEVRRRRVAEVL
ncbi:hypothetical protein QE152_g35952 [Popillia japonica]|uniref:Uncharacterized protein n=1 Tax=Popillia japonica TaxID=7064 RepID=A0AAW1IEB4_POPJA